MSRFKQINYKNDASKNGNPVLFCFGTWCARRNSGAAPGPAPTTPKQKGTGFRPGNSATASRDPSPGDDSQQHDPQLFFSRFRDSLVRRSSDCRLSSAWLPGNAD